LWLINALYFGGGTVFYVNLKYANSHALPAPNRLRTAIKAKACLAYQTVALTLIILLLVTLRSPPLLLWPWPRLLSKCSMGSGAAGKNRSIWFAWVWRDFHALAFAGLVAVILF
jgi:hypothetical protein